MEYNLTREKSAEILGISTRTLDRRIRSGKLTHSKNGNKVMLAEEELINFGKDKKQVSNVVLEGKRKTSYNQHIAKKMDIDTITQNLGKQINENMSSFLEVLLEKDKKLESKNQIIFTLQQRVVEAETKLKNSMALPQYETEKKEIILEKENLKYENKILGENLKKENIKNIALVGVIVIFIIILIIVVSS